MLVLDEPTNHLDLESREALEDALQAFPGSLLLVTHDRALLDAVGTRTIAVEDYTLHSYVGGWAEYARVREERKALGDRPRPTASTADGRGQRIRRRRAAPGRDGRRRRGARGAQERRTLPRRRPRRSGPRARRRTARRTRRAWRPRSRQAEQAFAQVEDELADPAAWATPYESAKSTARHTAARRAVEDAYAALEEFEARSAESAQA